MANFSNTTFNHNAYFDETNFKGEVSFNHSEFYKNVNFYKTKFKEIPKEAITQGDIPDFFQTTFNGNIKLAGTKLFDLDFEQLKALIEKKEGKQNE